MQHRFVKLIILFFCIGYAGIGHAETLVSENFNDRAYGSPLTFYNVSAYNADIVWDSANAIGGSGYCLRWDHTNASAGIGILENFASNVGRGVYIRYWVNYASNYVFPAEQGDFDNLKMFKLASGGGLTNYDIEFIYKDTGNGGPASLQLFWVTGAGSTEGSGTGTGAASLGGTMAKGRWHKIEIYIQIASPSVVHVQVNDRDVYRNTNANILLPASAYTGAQQFQSIRASGSRTPAGRGFWYTDNVTVIAGEGDRCSSEPAEPGNTGGGTNPTPTPTPSSNLVNQPAKLSMVSWTANSQTGDTTWADSTAVWCVRALVDQNSIQVNGNNVVLGFQGRSSGTYTIRKVSIAEKDSSGQDGNIVDSTWRRVSFDNRTDSTWSTDSITIPAGQIKRSNAIPFALDRNKDYYVTFMIETPGSYLTAPSDYNQLYFDGVDHTDDLDWSANGHSVYAGRLHGLSSISVTQ
jgi:hypothetical protein